MADSFLYHPRGMDAPAENGFSVSPNDSTDLSMIPRSLYVGGAGSVSVILGGATLTFASVPAGSWLPIRPTRIRATGTTATNIVAVY